nr:hypothetical protein [Tanacetum cinerariifolium]
MGRDTVQLKTAVNTISQEYLLEFTSEYGIPETLHPELPGPEDRIVDFSEGKVGVREEYPQCYTKPLDYLKNWNNRFFWVDERVFPTVVNWRTNSPKDGMPAESTYSIEAIQALDTHRTPIQKQPEMLLCLVGISRRYYLRDEVKTGRRPRAPHEVPLLTLTATRVIEMDDPAVTTDSSGVPSTIERSPLDFAHDAGISDQGTVASEMPPSEDVPATDAPGAGQAEEVAATDPHAATDSRKRGRDRTDVNVPPKSLRRDHADPRPTGSAHGGKSLAAIKLGLASTHPVPVPENAPAGVSDPDPLSFADPPSRNPADIAQSSQGTAAAEDPYSENASSPVEVGSPESIYRPEWDVANGSLLDTPEACQDLVDHVAPPGYFYELRHLHNDEFLRQYNVNLARQVAMGSQLRLRFEQEAKLLRKSVAQVARRDQRIQARELEIKNLEALLETEADIKKAAKDRSDGLSQELEDMRARIQARELEIKNLEALLETEADMKKAAKDRSDGLSQELEDMCARFSDLQVSNERLSQQVAALQEQRCVEMEARLDALSIDFDEELYPHMLTAIAGRRWAFADVVSAGIAKGISEGLRHGVEHGQAHLSLESIEAYDPEAEAKYVAALQALKDLKYPLVDKLEGLKDAPMDLTIPVYPEYAVLTGLALRTTPGLMASPYLCPL